MILIVGLANLFGNSIQAWEQLQRVGRRPNRGEVDYGFPAKIYGRVSRSYRCSGIFVVVAHYKWPISAKHFGLLKPDSDVEAHSKKNNEKM